MTYEIRLTVQAEDDLRNIYEYIAFSLQSPQNAARLLERLEESIDSLDEMPERFRIYEKEPWYSRYLRIMPVDNYLVLYIINHRKKVVTIVDILYSRQDIDQQLKLYENDGEDCL